jgi:flagellar basal-body rod protein FlgB
MDLLLKKMSYLNKSQIVHAENVSNANTPGYKALDIKPFTFGDALKEASVDMSVTNPRHIIPASLAGVEGVGVRAKTTGPQDSGDIEMESMKVSQAAQDYQLVTSIYHKLAGLFKIALKGNP